MTIGKLLCNSIGKSIGRKFSASVCPKSLAMLDIIIRSFHGISFSKATYVYRGLCKQRTLRLSRNALKRSGHAEKFLHNKKSKEVMKESKKTSLSELGRLFGLAKPETARIAGKNCDFLQI